MVCLHTYQGVRCQFSTLKKETSKTMKCNVFLVDVVNSLNFWCMHNHATFYLEAICEIILQPMNFSGLFVGWAAKMQVQLCLHLLWRGLARHAR